MLPFGPLHPRNRPALVGHASAWGETAHAPPGACLGLGRLKIGGACALDSGGGAQPTQPTARLPFRAARSPVHLQGAPRCDPLGVSAHGRKPLRVRRHLVPQPAVVDRGDRSRGHICGAGRGGRGSGLFGAAAADGQHCAALHYRGLPGLEGRRLVHGHYWRTNSAGR